MLKKSISLFAVFLLLFSQAVYASPPEIKAKGVAVLEAGSGNLIYGINENDRLPMASTTKVMTALIAIESGKFGMEITVTPEMAHVEGTSMGLRVGDKVTLRDLIFGMLLESGNDAANATAIALGGSISGFADMMNQKASEIGMKNTHFVTPSGLDDKDHYTSAYDLALLGVHAVNNPEFLNICRQKSAEVHFGNPAKTVTLYNHNKLLTKYKDCVGIKTGYTSKSGRCLLSAAQKDGVTIVVATLNNYSYWEDHAKLLDYGFSYYTDMPLNGDLSNIRLKLTGGTAPDVEVECAQEPKAAIKGGASGEVERRIFINPFEYTPIEKGRVVGNIQYFWNGKMVEEVQIRTARTVDAVPPPKKEGFFDKILSNFR